MIQQNAVRRKPTVEDTVELQRRQEAQLVEYQGLARRARFAVIAAKAAGDSAAEAQSMQETNGLAKKIAEITDAIETTKEALKLLDDREREEGRLRASDAVRKASATFKDKICVLADKQKAYADALMDARLEQDALEAVMIRAGITPDPYEFRLKFIPTVQIALHLATEGVLGERRTLDTPMQLEQSGRANLKRAATEYHELVMRRVRNVFGVTLKPPPEAA